MVLEVSPDSDESSLSSVSFESVLFGEKQSDMAIMTRGTYQYCSPKVSEDTASGGEREREIRIRVRV